MIPFNYQRSLVRMNARIDYHHDFIHGTAALGKSKEERDKYARGAIRVLCKTDLFYLLTVMLKRDDIKRPWLFERCCEVQEKPDGFLDLWAREHYKSTIITFGKTIQDVLKNPELCIGIFSHTKPIARAFLSQIKTELENNEELKDLFPDILWADPKKDAPAAGASWSLDKGITVIRKGNPKECTIESSGIVDGQPTSKHYNILVYDDIVTLESITSPEMIKKTTDALAISYNLGAHGGARRFIGTRYHLNDTYAEVIRRGSVKVRLHPATVDGKDGSEPVFLTMKSLADKRRDMGIYVYGCQMLQDPKADGAMGFKREWVCFFDTEPEPETLNIAIVVDPANEKRKESDYTSIWVVGAGPDRNYYLLDGLRDRLNLSERTDALFQFHYDYSPDVVGYERYGMQADIQHIKSVMDDRTYRFSIHELKGATPKPDRIRRLVPLFEYGKMWLPRQLWYTTTEGKRVDLIKLFLEEEYDAFPVMGHDDMFDNLANIKHPDLPFKFPKVRRRPKKKSWEERLRDKMREAGMDQSSGSAMTA